MKRGPSKVARFLKHDPNVRRGFENANAIAKAGALLRQLREQNRLTQKQLGFPPQYSTPSFVYPSR